jgi:single-strand DNA-binding protein|nr:MAG TPA: Single strand binding protein [Caudoviricetes sp.]
MNKVQLVGRLTRDPETRYSQSTQPIAVTRFSVAVNRRFKKDGEPDTDFINCVSFGKTAEFISKYFTKGKMIGIAGCIRTNSWTDKNGQKHFSTDVLVEEVEFCGSKADETSGNIQQQNEDYYIAEEVAEDDNLPF